MEMVPWPIEHMQVELLFSAGILAIMTLLAPGVQGAEITGVQVWGVSTPLAAEVAADTAGLAIEVHIVKPAMLTYGLLSLMLAAGMLAAITLLVGSTVNEPGAEPKEHIIMAPLTT